MRADIGPGAVFPDYDGSDDHDGPGSSGWNVGSVRAGTREPLVVELDAPIDGRDVDYLGNLEDASGNRLNGHFESPSTAPEPVAADVYIPLAIDRALVTRKRRLQGRSGVAGSGLCHTD